MRLVVGTSAGRIRAMFDFHGKPIRKAGPATPVLVMGLGDVPSAGDVFEVVASEREARAIVESRKVQAQQKIALEPKATLEELFSRYKAGELQELRLIVKADVVGSLEPIISSLQDIPQTDIKINILHAEAGNISESDVMLASASSAIIIGFNVAAEAPARRLADAEGISIRLYDIIYRLQEDVEKRLKACLNRNFVKLNWGRD